MAYQIPKIEPTAVVAGDRIQWTKDFSDFPAGTWTLTYYLLSRTTAGPPISFAATASGSTHSIDVTAADSAAWPVGEVFWQAFVTSGTDRKLVGEGRIEVQANPAGDTVLQPIDMRSWARRCRDNLRDVMEGKASRDTIRYVMQAVGRSEDKFTWEDIIAALSYFEGLVQGEEEAEAIERGDVGKKNIVIRFNT